MVSEALVEACRRGESAAFEEVIRTTYRHVYTQAFRLVGDPQEAEDVTQDAYLRMFRSLDGFRGESLFETWLYRIVANAALSHLRRRKRFGELLLDDPRELEESRPVEGPGPEIVVDRQVLAAALAELPASLRVPLVLKDVYGLSCQEIGEQLGVSEGAVKVRLHRGRRRLQSTLSSDAE